MKIARSWLGFGALLGALNAYALNTSSYTAATYNQLLGSCGSTLQPIYVFALTAGRLSLAGAQYVSLNSPASFCTAIANDPDCSNAQNTVNCVTQISASKALNMIQTLSQYCTSAGQPTGASGAALTTVEQELGANMTAVSAATACAFYGNALLAHLDTLLPLEINGTGTFVACEKQQITDHTNGVTSGCGSQASSSSGTSDPLTDPFSATNQTQTAAAQASESAWAGAQVLSTFNPGNGLPNNYRPLSARLRTEFVSTRNTVVPMPITRDQAARSSSSSSSSSSTATSGSNAGLSPNGLLTANQAAAVPANQATASCFPTGIKSTDAAFVADKPGFLGDSTLHIYEIEHAGSESTQTVGHAVLTTAFNAMLPSSHMEDAKNASLQAAGGTPTLYYPFVRVRGYCPPGATTITFGGSAAPRVAFNIAQNNFSSTNQVTCTSTVVGGHTYNVFQADLSIAGTPGTHFLEFQADKIGAAGTALTCKTEIDVVSSSGIAAYTTYLQQADLSSNATLRTQPHISASLTLNALTGN